MKYISRLAKIIVLASALVLLLATQGMAADVVSNSADWRDVYSSVLYANLAGATPHFLTGTAHGPIMLYELPKNSDSIQIITSADRPFYIGYESLMKSRGYENVAESIWASANLELAKKLPQINKFIILDDAYGYNALAVAPFAAKARYYVIFANRQNIDDVSAFLQTKTVEDLIIYGHTVREVRAALTQYNPEVLNTDTGSRFENNMLILDKYAEIGSIKQVILTNGEFIEASMMTGNEPVLFIGKNNVPTEVKNYINKSGIEIGVLIGNELIGTATDIRRQAGISVFVKFARGSRVPGGTINPVEDLDRFPMPTYRLSLSIISIVYNRATGQLEVTYRNNADIATYFRTTITVKDENGEILVVDGDVDTTFIDGGETKTIVYSKIKDVNIEKITEALTGEIYTIYGESTNALENVLRGTFPIELIDIKDDADIEIVDLVYDKSSGKFYITIENVGLVDAYVTGELVDLWVNGALVTVSSADVIKIEPGKKKQIPVEVSMEQDDLTSDRNQKILVRAIYGERKQALIKVKTKEFGLKIKSFDATTLAIVGGAVLLIILLLLFFFKRRKIRCKRCRHMNNKDSHHCSKCGHPLKEQ